MTEVAAPTSVRERDETALDDDVCIVGGGPAGLTLALLLLRSGLGVVLVERSRTLERGYRGEILQPGGLAILDQLGVLDGIRERGAYDLTGFRLLAGDRVLMDIDYTKLEEPYNKLVSVPQQHVLAELLAHCDAYATFTYLPGFRIHALIEREDAVAGIVASDGTQERRITARWVVGADGRYSRTRALAGIDAGRIDAFDQDVLWFKLDAPDRLTGEVRIRRGALGAAIVHDSYPGRLQVGWTLPHRGYRDISARGIDYVKQQLCTLLPDLADLIEAQITGLSDLTLLDVFGGCADRWARDGLVLIGDSAHTHGPLGAQGINLAIQDAALLHAVLAQALKADQRAEAAVAEFVAVRRGDADRVLKMQRMQSKGMLSHNPVADTIRPILMKLIGRTPIGPKITRRIAFGNPDIRVHDELFSPATPQPEEENV